MKLMFIYIHIKKITCFVAGKKKKHKNTILYKGHENKNRKANRKHPAPTNQVRALRVTVGAEHAQSALLSGSHNNTPRRSGQSRPSALGSSSSIVPAGSRGSRRGWSSGNAAGDASDSDETMALDLRRFPKVRLLTK